MPSFKLDVDDVLRKLIWIAVFIVIITLSVELFFEEFARAHHQLIYLADVFVISVFATELIVRFYKIRDVKLFLRKYWFDVLAVLSFFVVARFLRTAKVLEELNFAKGVVEPSTLSEAMKSSRLIEARSGLVGMNLLVAHGSKLPKFLKLFKIKKLLARQSEFSITKEIELSSNPNDIKSYYDFEELEEIKEKILS